MCIRPTVPTRNSASSCARKGVERTDHRLAAAATGARPLHSLRAPSSKLHAPSGFTLLEVIAAMALIVFLIGGVYSVGSGSVALGASINRSRIVETRISSFVSVWREYLETLPPGIRFSCKDSTLLIENGTVPFAWNRSVRRADAVEFAFEGKRGADGADFMVRHLKRPQKPTTPDEYKIVAELPILEGMRALDWKFYEPVDKKWLSEWDAKKRPQPPLFMRLHFGFKGDPREFEYTFWVANDFITPQNPAPAQPQNPNGQPAAPRP
jgi:prepilin-type N-terminal cleavage/methylation domain-containing protein